MISYLSMTGHIFSKLTPTHHICLFQSSTSITAALYEPQEVALEITSPFPEAGDFKVQLYETGDRSLLSTSSPKSR